MCFSSLLMIESFLNNKYLFLVHLGMFFILREKMTYGFILPLFCIFLALLNDLWWNDACCGVQFLRA